VNIFVSNDPLIRCVIYLLQTHLSVDVLVDNIISFITAVIAIVVVKVVFGISVFSTIWLQAALFFRDSRLARLVYDPVRVR